MRINNKLLKIFMGVEPEGARRSGCHLSLPRIDARILSEKILAVFFHSKISLIFQHNEIHTQQTIEIRSNYEL